MKEPYNSEDTVARLLGARLTSVQFILDYLILGFDAKGALTTLVWPEIHAEGSLVIFGMDGYRNDLCSLIEQILIVAEIDKNDTTTFGFKNGVKLRIPLGAYTGRGERAILTGPLHYLFVF
jgi:hypothetical protein